MCVYDYTVIIYLGHFFIIACLSTDDIFVQYLDVCTYFRSY